MRFPNPNLLLYTGMADAYAMSCEYIKFPRDEATLAEALHFKQYSPNPKYSLRAGTYTDDTEMSVANARVLMAKRSGFQPIDFADAYVNEFRRGGKRNGYSHDFQAFLERTKDGAEFLARIKPISNRNGAAMRAMPIGVLPTVPEVLAVATLQASLTHNTPSGRFSARFVALMAHYALYEDGALKDVGAYCARHLMADEDGAHDFKRIVQNPWPMDRRVVGYSHEPVSITTVHAVATLVMTSSSLMDILERTLRMGGDTDSVAAIAWAIASCRFQHETLPEFFVRDLEHGNSAYLSMIGTELMNAYR
jgi:ADP-ribosylglycohydrolase